MISCFRIALDFDLMRWTFGKFPIVMWLWGCMTLSTVLVVYPAYHQWATNRTPGPVGKSKVLYFLLYILLYNTLILTICDSVGNLISLSGITDYIWLSAYLIYQVAFLIIPAYLLLSYELPIASSVIISTEQVRHNQTRYLLHIHYSVHNLLSTICLLYGIYELNQ